MIDLNARTSTLSKMFLQSRAVGKDTTIELNNIPTEWNNGTGYFDGAVKGIELDAGSIAYGISANDRLVVIVGTHLGNIVLFERFSGGDSSVTVSNIARGIDSILFLDGNIPESMLEFILGRLCMDNIGKRLVNASNS